VTVRSLENYLNHFFEEEKKSLLSNYPGLTIHRLKQDIKLHAFLNGLDFEEIFEFPYLPHRHHPLTIFFEKLIEGVPLEYITGYAYFYKSHFKVTSDVLIPRSETEILVEMASNEIKKSFKNKSCRILDVGTGSGVIALSVMMECSNQLEVVASDISDKALRVARENYFNQHFAISKNHSLHFVKSDRLQNIEGTFDIILSNPPYIKRRKDAEKVHHQVLSFEPHMALFLEDDVYEIWFEDFFKSILDKLNPNGFSILEGHENHLQELKEMALKLGFSKASVIQDYTQRDRFIRLTK
jgi:release factor glutamine methyltransferase